MHDGIITLFRCYARDSMAMGKRADKEPRIRIYSKKMV